MSICSFRVASPSANHPEGFGIVFRDSRKVLFRRFVHTIEILLSLSNSDKYLIPTSSFCYDFYISLSRLSITPFNRSELQVDIIR
jgi:hypothetical protein